MAKLYILADRLTANGLMLGGVKGVTVANEANVVEKIQNIPAGTDMLLITGALANVAKDALERTKKKGFAYSVIPDMVTGHEDSAKRLIKEAIGFDLG